MIRRAAATVAALVAFSLPAALLAAPLRAGDHIAVTVFNHPELTLSTATIDGEGMLAMPLVGNVTLEGLEPEVAASRIADALKSYVRQPVVSLSVIQQNATISIIGGVTSSLPYVPGETLSSVAATLETSPGLDLHHVIIERQHAKYGEYDTLALLRQADPGPALQPADELIVALKPIGVNVQGVVKTTGMVYLDNGATIADAVAAAGGASGGDAATGNVDLLRDGAHQHLALSSNAADMVARDGDLVTVPEAVHVSVSGMVVKAGDTVLKSGNTLVAAIYEAGGPVRYGDMSHTEVIHDGVRHVYDITRVPNGDVSQNPHLAEGDIVNVPQGKHVNLGDIFGAAGVIHWFF
jgi:protein involved in polysaccharide export with SLBB domain